MRRAQGRGDIPRKGSKRLLADTKAGDAAALSLIIPVVYDELTRVARAHLRREGPGQVLQTTGLVHEAYLKLADSNACPS
jgi:hypothetical protein